ncbi:MAG: S41 family peptidase [Thermomicrobiales bacterium]
MSVYRRLSPFVRAYLIFGLVVTFGIGCFGGGMLTERAMHPAVTGAAPPAPTATPGPYDDFTRVWQLVNQEYYYKPVDPQQMNYAAIRGMLATLGDGYTVFLEPVQQQGVRQQMSGDYEGIGVYLESSNGQYIISSPMQGAPAEQAGIRARDVILRVDGKDVTGLPQDDVINMLKGKAGTVVHLTLQRPSSGATLDLDITRAVINIPSVNLRMLDGDIALISVSVFGDKTTAQLDGALKDAQAAHAKGIILDLRNNGGGWVQAAQEMIGRFVDPARGPALLEDKSHGEQAKALLHTPTPAPTSAGTPVATPPATPATMSVADTQQQPIVPPKDGPTFYDIPLVVLVNGGTASASEIVVGALQDYGRATVVGTLTFGKGSIQAVHEFGDGSSARITIAQWLTPKGRVIQKHGLQPDIVVEQPQSGGDAQLDRAIAVLQGK